MSKQSLHLLRAEKMYRETLCRPENLTVSFVYEGKRYEGLGGVPMVGKKVTVSETGEKQELRFMADNKLQITLETAYCPEFGEMEYTLWFENVGNTPTGELRDVYALTSDFCGADPVLRGCLGDHSKYYEAYENRLLHGDSYFRSDNGRATHIVFPYFDLVHGDGGTLIALGWAGTWEALFSAHGESSSVKAKTDIRLCASLMPGEKIRTGLIVLIPYQGRSADDATNLWREWFMKYNLPKADADGTPIHSFMTEGFAGDTGLPNSDGSISERYFTWQPTLEKIVKEDIVPDFRWFDAGWYTDPAGNTVETDWWGTIGSWELDREKWPGTTFRESNEACHALGMRVFAWFEPERVTHVEELCDNFGYKEEWAIPHGSVITNNIGDAECLKWTLGRIIKMLDENAVDMYREDNNSDPAYSWMHLDERDEASYGVKRSGINENKCICGHYALWDGIINYCAKNGKCTFVDSCASGGGRNDIESMRRGVPMMRSDYDRTTSAMRLSQTTSFCKWIPFHGSTVKETETQLETSKGAGSDSYVARASYLPIYNITEAFVHNPELDFELMRKNIGEWKSLRHLLTRDLYVLTPWHHSESLQSWTALAYDAPELGESVVMAFRMEEADEEEYTAVLPFAREAATYCVVDADTGEMRTMTGTALQNGITIRLSKPKSSALLRIRVIG